MTSENTFGMERSASNRRWDRGARPPPGGERQGSRWAGVGPGIGRFQGVWADSGSRGAGEWFLYEFHAKTAQNEPRQRLAGRIGKGAQSLTRARYA